MQPSFHQLKIGLLQFPQLHIDRVFSWMNITIFYEKKHPSGNLAPIRLAHGGYPGHFMTKRSARNIEFLPAMAKRANIAILGINGIKPIL